MRRFLAAALMLAGCKTVEIKDTRECTVAGVFQAGFDCATTNSSEVSQMDLEQSIEWLEPQPERTDPVTKKKLPARAGAICRSDEDFTAQKTQLEQACALLRDRCTPEIKKAIESATLVRVKNEARLKKTVPAEVSALLHAEEKDPPQ